MQIFAILGLILKFLPYIAPVLKGLFGALDKLGTAEKKDGTAVIDPVKLQEFVEAQTAKIIRETIEKHRGELIAYVPTEEEAAREKKIDDLLSELEKAQKEYEDDKGGKDTPPQKKNGGGSDRGTQTPIP